MDSWSDSMSAVPDIKVERIKDPHRLIELWPFFLEGLQECNRLCDPEQRLSSEFVFQVALQALRSGHIAVYWHEGKQGGFTITVPADPLYVPRPTAIIYLAYARKTVPGGTRFAVEHVEKWARNAGFEELQAFSPRINGSGFAFFEKRLKFRRHLVCFYKRL